MLKIKTYVPSKDDTDLIEGSAYINSDMICGIDESEDYEDIWLVELVSGSVYGVDSDTKDKLIKNFNYFDECVNKDMQSMKKDHEKLKQDNERWFGKL